MRRRHRGIKASRHRAEKGRKAKSHPQITQIGRRLFKRILREEERQRKASRHQGIEASSRKRQKDKESSTDHADWTQII